MKRGPAGSLQTVAGMGGEVVRAFIPAPLPPVPPLQIDDALRERLDRAHVALGRLDSVTTLLPDTQLFLYTYVRKEAVLSSQIEGTKSTLSDLLLFEAEQAPGVPVDDVTEVSSYVAALEHGLARINDGFPLSNRLMDGERTRIPASSDGPRTGWADRGRAMRPSCPLHQQRFTSA
jgi:hypothetical protein